MRILVVEDDPKLGALLEQGLGEEGLEVELVTDGVEAVAAALAGSYDLVLLDYMLPRKSGVDVAIELRAAGRTTPILMLTARDAPEDLRRAREAGINEIMGKPFRFGELLDRIQAVALPGAGGG
jgi:two-component system OmpR family response regulator